MHLGVHGNVSQCAEMDRALSPILKRPIRCTVMYSNRSDFDQVSFQMARIDRLLLSLLHSQLGRWLTVCSTANVVTDFAIPPRACSTQIDVVRL